MKWKTLISAALMLVFLSACSAVAPTPTLEQTIPTEPAVLERLEIARLPDKTTYILGESFDSTGLVVDAVFSDGSVQRNVQYAVEENPSMTTATLGVVVTYEGKGIRVPISVILPGNSEIYSAENMEVLPDSPLQGKTFFWLGSSVTQGASALNQSMADFLAAKHSCVCIKEAVSGTTLANNGKDSYVARLDQYLASEGKCQSVDVFICQLSTNDQKSPENWGTMTANEVRSPEAFDTTTTIGAMEYIIARARETWDCPVVFYTNPPTKNENYLQLVLHLYAVAQKWDITLIDLYMDIPFQHIPSEEQYHLWMADVIHPTKAGYRDWWLPKFEETFFTLMK